MSRALKRVHTVNGAAAATAIATKWRGGFHDSVDRSSKFAQWHKTLLGLRSVNYDGGTRGGREVPQSGNSDRSRLVFPQNRFLRNICLEPIVSNQMSCTVQTLAHNDDYAQLCET